MGVSWICRARREGGARAEWAKVCSVGCGEERDKERERDYTRALPTHRRNREEPDLD